MVVETVTFRLAAPVDEDAFVAAEQRVQNEFVPNLPGFIRRTAARAADGGWIVVTLWGALAAAESASELSQNDPTVGAWNGWVDAATLRTNRYETLD